MQQLFQGVSTYIQSWQAQFALVAFVIGLIAWICGARMWAIAEVLIALSLIFTASTLLPQLGL